MVWAVAKSNPRRWPGPRIPDPDTGLPVFQAGVHPQFPALAGDEGMPAGVGDQFA